MRCRGGDGAKLGLPRGPLRRDTRQAPAIDLGAAARARHEGRPEKDRGPAGRLRQTRQPLDTHATPVTRTDAARKRRKNRRTTEKRRCPATEDMRVPWTWQARLPECKRYFETSRPSSSSASRGQTATHWRHARTRPGWRTELDPELGNTGASPPLPGGSSQVGRVRHPGLRQHYSLARSPRGQAGALNDGRTRRDWRLGMRRMRQRAPGRPYGSRSGGSCWQHSANLQTDGAHYTTLL